MLGAVLAVAGVLLTTLGMRLADRPITSLVAPAGLCLALLGMGRWLSPDFFGRRAPEPLRIMPAGDSITRGAFGGGRDGGYRGPLWARLATVGRRIDMVGTARNGPMRIDADHEAWDGITVRELGRRLQRDLPAQRPDVILLDIGTNDLVDRTDPDAVAGAVAELVDTILIRPRVQVLVGSLGVRIPNDRGVDPASAARVNALLRDLVGARGPRARFVPLDVSDFLADGLHPSQRGYLQIAERWFEALRPAMIGP